MDRKILILICAILTARLVAADCCTSDGNDNCADGPEASWQCCGVGACNIFCCNCDGGCRQPSFEGCLTLAAEEHVNCMAGYQVFASTYSNFPMYGCMSGAPLPCCNDRWLQANASCYMSWNSLMPNGLWASLDAGPDVPIVTLDDCLTSATNNYTSCMNQPVPCNNTDPYNDCTYGSWENGYCQKQYSLQNTSCSAQFSKRARRSSSAGTTDVHATDPHARSFRRDGPDTSGSTAVSDLFHIADVDKGGNLSLSEFLSVVNLTKGGKLTSQERTRPWVKRFLAFDQDNDGFITADEAHARFKWTNVFGARVEDNGLCFTFVALQSQY